MKIQYDENGLALVAEISLAVLVLAVVSFAGFRVSQSRKKTQESTNGTSSNQAQSYTYQPSTKNQTTVTSIELNASFTLPTGWTKEIPKDFDGKPTTNELLLKSSDYQEEEAPIGATVPTKGASILISISDKPRDITNYQLSAGESNLKMLKVDGQDAIQIDVSYEGVASVNTFLNKNGHSYSIDYNFPGDGKDVYFSTYQSVVTSFKVN